MQPPIYLEVLSKDLTADQFKEIFGNLLNENDFLFIKFNSTDRAFLITHEEEMAEALMEALKEHELFNRLTGQEALEFYLSMKHQTIQTYGNTDLWRLPA